MVAPDFCVVKVAGPKRFSDSASEMSPPSAMNAAEVAVLAEPMVEDARVRPTLEVRLATVPVAVSVTGPLKALALAFASSRSPVPGRISMAPVPVVMVPSAVWLMPGAVSLRVPAAVGVMDRVSSSRPTAERISMGLTPVLAAESSPRNRLAAEASAMAPAPASRVMAPVPVEMPEAARPATVVWLMPPVASSDRVPGWLSGMVMAAITSGTALAI